MTLGNANWRENAEPKKLEVHPHYNYNLSIAKTFISNTQKELLEGMSVLLAEQDRLLMICWTPSIEIKVGRFAAPINLHQDSKIVETETELFFNSYLKMAKHYNKTQLKVTHEQDLF